MFGKGSVDKKIKNLAISMLRRISRKRRTMITDRMRRRRRMTVKVGVQRKDVWKGLSG